MRKLLLATMLVLAGCGTGPAAGQNAHGYRLYVEGLNNGVQVMTTSAAAKITMPAGFLTADGSQLYSSGGQLFGGSAGAGGVTVVNTFDGRTGDLARKVEVPGTWNWDGGGTSPDGRWLVLTNSLPTKPGSFLVLDTGPSGQQYPVNLGKGYNFDAINNDGSKLYLVQYLAGTSYKVRLYDVFSHTLQVDPVLVKSPEVEAMNGTKITAVADSAGHMLYSLYGRNDGRPPFVHALNLEASVAYCIDLPAIEAMNLPYLNSDASGWSLSLDDAHHALYASSSAGQVVAIDTQNYGVSRSAALSAPPVTSLLPSFLVDARAKAFESAPAASAIDPSGRWLYVAWGYGFLTVDTHNLRVVAIRGGNEVLSSLATSPDGRHLFGVNLSDRAVVDLEPQTGHRQATLAGVPQPWRILRLEPIA
jgi:hypothetical protein